MDGRKCCDSRLDADARESDLDWRVPFIAENKDGTADQDGWVFFKFLNGNRYSELPLPTKSFRMDTS